MKKVLVIAGLTASGKSSLAIELAHELNGEIISADSVAVYKELNVGSAKTPIEEREGIVHHLIDVTDIHTPYNVARFQEDARNAIDLIYAKGKLPIVVGGTGLYLNALIKDYRFELEHQGDIVEDDRDTEVLYQELVTLDPQSTESIHPNNRKRILRALESVKYHEKTRKDLNQDKKDVVLYDALVLFLQGDRKKVYERIESRVDLMFENGLVEEVSALYSNDPNVFDLQSMQSIGYREFKDYFLGNNSLVETSDLIKRNTRRFAKRQLTWFKHQMVCEWMDIFSPTFKSDVHDSIIKWQGETHE